MTLQTIKNERMREKAHEIAARAKFETIKGN